MFDAYKTLNFTRRAALDEGALQKAYAAHSRAAHPDHGGDESRAAEVNAAYEILRATDKRLKHLLELAAPVDAKQWRTVPIDEGMMSLFSELGAALEASAKFIDRKLKAQTALSKALLANEEMQQRESLERIGFELDRRRKEMEAELPGLDASMDWKQLGVLQAKFAYLAKWQTQVRESLLALM